MNGVFSVFLSAKARKAYRKLDAFASRRANEAIDALSSEPVPAARFDVEKLAGYEDAYRIRIGKYRIKYKVFWQEREIGILAIERRSETTYKKL